MVDNQRIDLHQLGIAAGIDRIEPQQEIDERVAVDAWKRRQCAIQRLGIEPPADVDRQPHQRGRMLGGDLLDVHAAFAGEQQQRPLRHGVVEHGCVHLGGNGDLLLDEHRLDAMLVDGHAENAGCGGLGLVRARLPA